MIKHIIRTSLIATLIAVFGVSLVVPPTTADAISTATFNPSRIMDDSIFFNGTRMGVNDIQAFLNAKVPTCDTNGTRQHGSGMTRAQWAASTGNQGPPYTCLRHFSQSFSTIQGDSFCSAVAGGTRSGADIIAAVAQACNVNPQVILVLLQKEQSFITDDWPWQIQYDRATGFACPDSGPNFSANCDPAYAGFVKQVYFGVRQFKKYVQLPGDYNHAVGRTSFVGYNPNPACGGTNITPNTQATAALYNYTPYQPNAATLAAPEGQTVDCGAYGNLNFWRKFNDWFGPTLTDEFAVIMANNGDPRQWVLENGVRYPIPDPAVKVAWGLSPSWDTPYSFSHDYVGSLPEGPALSRVIRPRGDLSVYLVDGGKKFRFGSGLAMNAWGYDATSIVDMPAGVSNKPSTQGDITYTASLSGDPRIFLVDGGAMRHITNPDILAAWAGDSPANTPVSTDYFNSRPAGGAITSPKITNGSTTYFVDNSRKLTVDSLTAQLFPAWATHTVSPATTNRLGNGPNATYVVKAAGSTAVHIVDQGTKHHVTDPHVFAAWQSSTFPSSITELTNGFMNSLGNGVQISDYLLSTNGSSYVMDRAARPVPAELNSAYATGRTVYAGSSQLLSIFPQTASVSGIVKPAGQPQVYVLTNAGKLRHLTSTNLYWLWARNQTVTELNPRNIERYQNLGGIGAFISDGTTNYLMEGGQKHVVDAGTKSEWGLGNPEVLDSGTVNRLVTGTPIGRRVQANGAFFMVHAGHSYGTTDANIAAIWNLVGAPAVDGTLLAEYLRGRMLTRVALSSTGDNRLFIVDRGILYRLYPNHAANLVADGPYTMVDPASFQLFDWTAAVVKDEAGVNYAVDRGTKRHIPAGVIRDQWTHGNYGSIPTMTNGFLNRLPNGPQMERVIKGSGPQVYAAENFTKRWILSSQTYNAQYAPYTTVSDALLEVLPNGVNIP